MLGRLPEEQHRHVLRCYWASINAILATYGEGYPAAPQLEEAWGKYSSVHDSATMRSDMGESLALSAEHKGEKRVGGVLRWQEIIDRAWAEDEEHNIKLVYVCRELWRRYGHWRGFRAAAETFTPTPDL